MREINEKIVEKLNKHYDYVAKRIDSYNKEIKDGLMGLKNGERSVGSIVYFLKMCHYSSLAHRSLVKG